MIDYDFTTLNDKEFENLSIDLISKDKNKRFERFKAGKDAGIDGRFYHYDGSQEIVQCKHYLKTGFTGLITSLKKKDNGINEIDKVKKLNPTRYIFVTSLVLSAENKKTIKELFDPYIKNDNDIYGQEDLNQILGNHSDIEKRHYKLWLSSTVVLDRIVNNAIESRSEFLLEDIKEKSKYYVVTKNHQKAIDRLEESHIIIIAGEPGIGKTTLAEHLALRYIEKEYKFYNIENSINEAESIYKRDENQIFYFDDFLGANYLNAIEDKKDSHIVKFMDRIKRDKTKRFILTSRTNIFNQSLTLSDIFKSKNIEKEEFIIKIESLKDIDKAHILYNHIWHSNLDEKFIDEIYIDERYKNIIKHKNFNPRLIEFITDIEKIKLWKIEVKNYWEYILNKLNNPQDVWQKAFDKDSDEFNRIVVMLTVFNGNRIEESKLRDGYNRYIELSGLQNSSHLSKEFDSIIKEVVKYFLNRSIIDNKEIVYSLTNPSIADFILNRYKDNEKVLINIFLSLETEKALSTLINLNNNYYLNTCVYKKILSKFTYKESNDIKYLTRLIYLIYSEFEEERLIDSELIDFEKKLHEILNIIIYSNDKIENRDINLVIRVINYPSYNTTIEITPELINKLIFSIDEYIYQDDLVMLFDLIDTNKISLRDNKYKDIFIKLRNMMENYLLYHEDKPQYLKKETIYKIEQIISNDIKEQEKNYIKNTLKSLGFKYSNLNTGYIQSRLNYRKINDSIHTDIMENIKDRLLDELFQIDVKNNISNIEKDSFTKNTKIDEFDDLFER